MVIDQRPWEMPLEDRIAVPVCPSDLVILDSRLASLERWFRGARRRRTALPNQSDQSAVNWLHGRYPEIFRPRFLTLRQSAFGQRVAPCPDLARSRSLGQVLRPNLGGAIPLRGEPAVSLCPVFSEPRG